MNRPLLILTLLLSLAGCQNGQRAQSYVEGEKKEASFQNGQNGQRAQSNVDGKEGGSELQSQDYQRDKSGQRVQSNVDGKEGGSELQSQDCRRDKSSQRAQSRMNGNEAATCQQSQSRMSEKEIRNCKRCQKSKRASRQRAQAIRSAVTNHLTLYPEAHLQDLYKTFFQAEFGAEHIVADTTAAGRYLDRELTTPDSSAILFEPIGADSAFYRVHLRAVQEGLITRDQLFQAFVGGVHAVEIPQIENWAQKWPQIIKVIDGMHLDLPDYDSERAAIDTLIARGKYATHHSEAFGKAYKPHYRIIRRDIFETQILPHL